MIRDGNPTDSFLLATEYPEIGTGHAGSVIARTRARHTRPRARVEAEIVNANTTMEGVFEGRVRIDADGVIGHRPPETRILIGERSPGERVAARIAELLTGRGLDAKTTGNVARLVWARSIFLAAGVGMSILTRRPLTDALRFHPGQTHFAHMVSEGRGVAAANDVEIHKATMWRYRHCLTLAGEPLMSPPLVTDPSGAGQEAFYLLTLLIRRPGGKRGRWTEAGASVLCGRHSRHRDRCVSCSSAE